MAVLIFIITALGYSNNGFKAHRFLALHTAPLNKLRRDVRFLFLLLCYACF